MNKLQEKIIELKKKRNALILVHNYQLPEVQDIADIVGDSLDLSKKAASTDAEVIVFCGVRFMAETAAILSPSKTVLLPDERSGCPMAEMVSVDGLKELKKKHPNAVVVSYINTNADVKAESDICCTSSNAVEVVKKFMDKEIIFVPDQNLGNYVQQQTGKKMILWNGFCSTHMLIKKDDIIVKKKKYPNAEVLAHPECSSDVVSIADKTLSTNGMCLHVKSSSKTEFIIGTENGIIHRLKKENPGKIFIAASDSAFCQNMKKNTLEKIVWALEDMNPVIKVPTVIAEKARKALERMLEEA